MDKKIFLDFTFSNTIMFNSDVPNSIVLIEVCHINSLTLWHLIATYMLLGAVAQLGERLNGIQEVSGSIPLSSTPSVKQFVEERRGVNSPLFLSFDL